MVDLNYLRLNKFERFFYRVWMWIAHLPLKIWGFIKKIPSLLGRLFRKIGRDFKEVYEAFRYGDFKTRISFIVMGFGQLCRGEIIKGLAYLIFYIVFILYMVFFGWKYLSKLHNLGDVAMVEEEDPLTGITQYKYYDNSQSILLYSIVTILLIGVFVYLWFQNVRQNKVSQEMLEIGKKVKGPKEEMGTLMNEQYHKTLLALPIGGLVLFTLIPIIFMILIGFTNYDSGNMPPAQLFTWVGWSNFKILFNFTDSGAGTFSYTFGQILIWTLVWAFFATFTNYFLGMFIAMLINKKGIKLKKLWRSILVITIAVPQFVSLLFIGNLLDTNGLVNAMLIKWHVIQEPIGFLTTMYGARITVILVNVWVGVPYSMLICTGILMNIPADLYESAKIDGANSWHMYTRITLPYMFFVTGPYLISQFVGNLNNFNIIYLLTNGYPLRLSLKYAGRTDLLITWLYKLTFGDVAKNYKVASVIGVCVFLIVSIISLIFYSKSSSVKNEEDFQ